MVNTRFWSVMSTSSGLTPGSSALTTRSPSLWSTSTAGAHSVTWAPVCRPPGRRDRPPNTSSNIRFTSLSGSQNPPPPRLNRLIAIFAASFLGTSSTSRRKPVALSRSYCTPHPLVLNIFLTDFYQEILFLTLNFVFLYSICYSSQQDAERWFMRGPGIGEYLVNTRRSRMWTQGRLAREAGVSPTTVSGIETGKIGRPHFGTVQKLARALDVDPQLLLPSGGPLA